MRKKKLRKLKKENAELKRQLDVRQKRQCTNYKVTLQAENIVNNLKEKFNHNMIKDILVESIRALN